MESNTSIESGPYLQLNFSRRAELLNKNRSKLTKVHHFPDSYTPAEAWTDLVKSEEDVSKWYKQYHPEYTD